MSVVLLRQLAATVHPSDSREKPLALLKVYFDESGIHAGAKVTAMAGFIAPALKWIAFEKAWQRRLKQDDVPYFHMTECEAGRGRIFGPMGREKREALIHDLADLICEHDLSAIVSAVVREDWDAVKHPEFKSHFPEPYNFCFEQCLQDAHRWTQKNAKRDKIALIFAEQTQFRDRSRMIYDAYASSRYWGKFRSFTFIQAKKMAALQAADMLVYEIYRMAMQAVNGDSDNLRSVYLKFIMNDVRLMGRFHTKEALQAAADAGPTLPL